MCTTNPGTFFHVLEDLATVDWAALPDLLRAATDGDAGALDELHTLLCDRGTIGDATPYAVPYLIRSLDALTSDPPRVLALLADIVRADAYDEPYWHEKDEPARAAAERTLITAARTAVAAGLPSYLRLLAAHPDDDVRLGAAHLIGALGPDVAGGASAALHTASAVDRAEPVRAAAVLALGDRGETADDRLADPAPLVRLSAALVLAAADPEAPLPGPVVQILERDAPDALDRIAGLPGFQGEPLEWVLRALRPRRELQVRLVTGWLRHPAPEVRAGAGAWRPERI